MVAPDYVILALFNIPVLVTAVALIMRSRRWARSGRVSAAVLDAPFTYSRSIALIGTVLFTSFFWAGGNAVLLGMLREAPNTGASLIGLASACSATIVLFIPYLADRIVTPASSKNLKDARLDGLSRHQEDAQPARQDSVPLAPAVVPPQSADVTYLRGKS